MCIAAWIWQSHPHYPLILLFNRDEYHNRPTKPVAWWEDSSQILGGRDCLAGGTWLASTRNGRLAFLTNVMEPDQNPNAKSRGELPVRFLESKKSPLDFAQEVIKEGDQYNGFNLIVADLCSKTMIYISNRPKEEPFTIQEVSPGLHVLSNAKLDTPWHKAQRLRRNFNKLLHKYGEKEVPAEEIVEQLMTDTVKADKEKLPNTGCDPEWEFMTSSICFRVDTPLGHCGTRSMVALSVKTSGEVNFYERYLEKNIWNSHTVQYHIENDL
ncbi:transport and Golgi organization 2 [Cinnamomum micranthum f. kanehirae]|uniref:Transport and Golgi organization 2 n=1 Tax=Cinnamomum micranthum f. kanehirae TaxID=337451 RepID=A0A443PII8_9MAGN|nr:transport and Golgi organization 2 [Cinnamomum micranthum f. kanehirae]